MNQPESLKNHSPVEVEQKYHLPDPADLERRLAQLGAQETAVQRHSDTYYRHPSRDFAQTREAFRIRRVLTEPVADAPQGGPQQSTLVTYKGPYEKQGVKSRPELEWRIDPCDPDGKNFASLLGYLGFSEILTVRKTRRSFSLQQDSKDLIVTIDDAGDVGTFAEVETIAAGAADSAACGALVTALAQRLGLHQIEKRSYLQMALQAAGMHR